MFIPTAIQQESIVKDGLVLWLDAGDKASYPGNGNTWKDLSGNSNNGTLVNGVGYSSSNGGGMLFDGSNDYGIINSFSDFNTNTFTIESWIKIDTLNVNKQILSRDDSSNTGFYPNTRIHQFRVSFTNNLNLILFDNSNSVIYNGNTSITLSTTKWYHVVSSLNVDNVKMYVDSYLDVNTTISNTFVTTKSLPVYIGLREERITEIFNGNISMIRFYNRALTPQ